VALDTKVSSQTGHFREDTGRVVRVGTGLNLAALWVFFVLLQNDPSLIKPQQGVNKKEARLGTTGLNLSPSQLIPGHLGGFFVEGLGFVRHHTRHTNRIELRIF